MTSTLQGLICYPLKMDREELEQELWRLRAVEYDLREARIKEEELIGANKILQAQVDFAKAQITKLNKGKEELVKSLTASMGVVKGQDERIQKLESQVEAQKNRITRLYEELGTKDYVEYLDHTYDFRVVDKVPVVRENTRPGWRLTK